MAVTQLLDLHYHVGFLLVLFLSSYFCVLAVFGVIFPTPTFLTIPFQFGSIMVLTGCFHVNAEVA